MAVLKRIRSIVLKRDILPSNGWAGTGKFDASLKLNTTRYNELIGALKKSREVKWVADSETRVAPSQSVSLVLRPRCEDDLVEHLEEMGDVP